MDYSPQVSGVHFLLQGVFLIQGSNLGLVHCRQILYQLSHQGSPYLIYVVDSSTLDSQLTTL